MPTLKLVPDRYAEGAAILLRVPGWKTVVRDPADPGGPPLWIIHRSQRTTAEQQLRAAGIAYRLVPDEACMEAEVAAGAADGNA